MPLNMVQGGVANVQSLPAPIGGWNARDSWADMAPTDAVAMENFRSKFNPPLGIEAQGFCMVPGR